MYFQYCLTFVAGAFFSVRLLGMASDAIPGDLVNADNELYIGAAFGAVMCLGIFFYNFWFYRISPRAPDSVLAVVRPSPSGSSPR